MMSYSNKLQHGQALILLIVAVVIVGAGFMAGGFNYIEPKAAPAGTTPFKSTDIIPAPRSSVKTNLQLDPLRFCKRTTGDDGICYPQNAGICCPNEDWARVLCKQGKCVGVELKDGGTYVQGLADAAGIPVCDWMENPFNYPPPGHQGFPVHEWCASESCKKIPDAFMCWGKPVVLLYPEKPTLVDVEVVTSGEIFISDPLYPEGGWKNVLANPDGSLVYQGKPYTELFYESKVKNYGTPPTGLIFKTSELKSKLPELLYKLGLEYKIETEIPEFMDFWLSKLYELKSPYIYVSLIQKEVKEKNDLVIITPEPDTRIELIIYFKPLDKRIDVTPLEIGERPVRTGFTMVEWGGTIDNN